MVTVDTTASPVAVATPVSPLEIAAEKNTKSSTVAAAATTTTTTTTTLSPTTTTTEANNLHPEKQEEETKEGDNEGPPPQEEQPAESSPATTATNNKRPVRLYKSRRFKGYLTVCLASVINFNAAILSKDPLGYQVVPASDMQQNYAVTVALISAIITGLLVLVHLDRYILENVWIQYFDPKSKFELGVIVFLVVWWTVATFVQTTIRGIAGDGRQQYNLYYSTWVCCWATLWTLERKMVDFGYLTFFKFVKSWPYRAPGWIAIFCSCFLTVFWYVDLFLYGAKNSDQLPIRLQPFYDSIPKSQYQWLLFIASFSLLPSAVFIFIEIFRRGDHIIKTSVENILEGCCLFLLTMTWIPAVTVVTTPGGFASVAGNAYYFTWATTIFVMETFLWYIHDFRFSIHRALEEKEKQYQEHQKQVLEKSLAMASATNNTNNAASSNDDQDDEYDDDDDDDNSDYGSDDDDSEDDDDDDDNDEEDPNRRPRKGRKHYMDDDDDDDDEDLLVQNITYGLQVPTPPRFPSEMEEIPYEEDSVQREIRLKEMNQDDYFENLNDIFD